MPTVVLKVTSPSPNGGEYRPPEIVRPLFRGSGDTDYLCGNCAAVIASGMGPTQRVNVDVATCSACGVENEFPLNLRG